MHVYIYTCSYHIYVTIEWYSSRTSTDSRLLQTIYNVFVGSHGGISRRNETLLDGAERGEKWPFWNGKTTVVNGVRFLLLVFFSRHRSRSPQDPRFGKISFGSVRCANSEGEFASIYTSCEVIQVVLNKSDLLRHRP